MPPPAFEPRNGSRLPSAIIVNDLIKSRSLYCLAKCANNGLSLSLSFSLSFSSISHFNAQPPLQAISHYFDKISTLIQKHKFSITAHVNIIRRNFTTKRQLNTLKTTSTKTNCEGRMTLSSTGTEYCDTGLCGL